MKINKNDFSIYPTFSGDYRLEEDKLKQKLYELPVLRLFEGWIHYMFKRLLEEGTIHFEFGENNGFIDDKLILTSEQESFVIKGYLKNGVESFFEDIINILPQFHMKFKNTDSYQLGKFYCYAYLYLRGEIDFLSIRELEVESDKLNLIAYKETFRGKIEEILQLVISLLSDLNASIDTYKKQIIEEYESLSVELDEYKTFSLVNEERFEKNLHSIYKKLVPLFLSRDTTHEQLEAAFAGIEQSVHPMKWMRSKSHLNYFCKNLKQKNKIYNGNYFQLAEVLFVVDAQGCLVFG